MVRNRWLALAGVLGACVFALAADSRADRDQVPGSPAAEPAVALARPAARDDSDQLQPDEKQPEQDGKKPEKKRPDGKQPPEKSPVKKPPVKKPPEKQPGEKPVTKPDSPPAKKPAQKPDAEKAASAMPASDKTATEEKAAAASKPETVKVDKGYLKVEVALDGTFEPAQVHELEIRPESWASFKILSAVPHGAAVKKGDVLVQLDVHDIEDALSDQQAQLELSKLDVQLAEHELQLLHKNLPVDLEMAETTKKLADDDFENYTKGVRPFSEKSVAQNAKVVEEFLEYALEELRQLEKMYKADDLTEETEEIILKRARNEVEFMKFMVEQQKFFGGQQLRRMGQEEIHIKQQVHQAAVALARARASLPTSLERATLMFKKSRHELEKSEERLARLKKDRAAMEVVAPADGLLYHGHFDRGQWSPAPSKVHKGDMLPAGMPFMTVVVPRPLHVRAAVPENQLHLVRAGGVGKGHPAAFPDLKLPTVVESVSSVPVSPGQFEARMSVGLGEAAAGVMPGMSCKLTLVAYERHDALTVPPGSVFSDEADSDRRYVWVYRASGAPEKRLVKVGRQTDKKLEILEGLQAGDEILKDEPKKP